MLEKDAVLSKIAIIKRCLETIKRSTDLKPENLDDIMTQDVFILNIQRCIQACIDIANIIISLQGWKLPASYKEAFSILAEKKVINKEMAEIMMKMCGFRNIAVHDYQQITPPIMKSVLSYHVKDFEVFYSDIYSYIQLLQEE